ncbi:DNA-binding LacI/PurR family transcriptional regulator [Kribbella voronezhensis]|uniref:DNA-binding LacI/PurR family transcriptional regulator n=1 Tax=Kribbella voronezhensis TaxID=2512212 RepID=A0A4R7SYN0_9ACTN|nr:GntR family transcriptional regulator [Kribbella voronezhensis]TDU84510.1 DNA-binding LacI/PurR family transcriptional regulator [Kribbella voronezhensis]
MALLYEQISSHVLDEIRRGVLGPGDRVASEMELAAQFEVSRITSKRALEVLREAGLIERIRGKGSFVVKRLPELDRISLPLKGRLPLRAARADGVPGAIALVVPDVSEAYGLELLQAIEERCAEHGANLIIRRTRGRQSDEEQAVESLVAMDGVDGLIVFPVHGDFYNASLLRQVLDGYPVVLVDRHLSGIPVSAVHTDNVAASRALTERLFELGHRQIAFVSPPPLNTSSIEDRLEGFRSAFADRDPGSYQAHRLTELRSTLPGSFTPESVLSDLELIRAFRERVPAVTAFVACEYNLARMLDRALGQPRELVISCFDSPGDPIAGPPYLHVRQNQTEMGRQAVDLLFAQLRGESVPKLSIVPFELIDAQRN